MPNSSEPNKEQVRKPKLPAKLGGTISLERYTFDHPFVRQQEAAQGKKLDLHKGYDEREKQ